jgi:hypothetical protein
MLSVASSGQDRVGIMPKRSSKPRDTSALTATAVAHATEPEKPDPYKGKNPAAVELGRLGGRKGGKARAAALSAEERSAVARKAAAARWANHAK